MVYSFLFKTSTEIFGSETIDFNLQRTASVHGVLCFILAYWPWFLYYHFGHIIDVSDLAGS